MSILLATPASIRQERKTKEIYDTIDLWMEMSQHVEGVDGIYLFLNDIPKKRRKEITKKADKLKIAWDYKDYGYIPDDRSNVTRRPDSKDATKDTDYERFVVCRNEVLDYALANNYTHLFFVDSDIMVRPCTAKSLMAQMTEGVALCSVLMNVTAKFIYQPMSRKGRHVIIPERQWRYNIANIVITPPENPNSFIHILRKNIKFNSLIRVGMTGACAILNLDYIKQGMRYQCHPYGEDMGLCEQFMIRNLKVHCNTAFDLEAFHIQHPELVENARQYLEGGKVNYHRKNQ